MSPQPSISVESDAKKVKLEPSVLLSATPVVPVPSRVVHLRNIPNDMTEVELLKLCITSGAITNYLFLKGKNQAFVEFDDELMAANLIRLLTAQPVNLRGRTIFAQFSNHQELKTDKHQTTTPAPTPASNNNTTVIVNGNGSVASPNPPSPSSTVMVHSGENGLLTTTQHQPNSVLRVIIENMLYPVSLDVLHTIFSKYGKVLRIITFQKNNTFQVLIQFSEANAAQMAKTMLDGQNVYNGCCTLRIEYSKLATLNVKYNNDKSRDYTNPNLPSGELTFDPSALALVSAAASAQAQGILNGSTTAANLAAFTNPFIFQAAANNPTAFSAASSFPQCLSALTGGASLQALPQTLNLGQTQMTAAQNALGLKLPAQFASAFAMSPVVLVSNLNEEKVTCDALFTLFGVYGDVQRVKILFNKKDNALIQYSEPQQAQLAIQHLDKIRIWDRQIHVTGSKHTNVQMPKEGQPDAGLTKDYSQSPLHRFKKPGSKNYMNIYPPSATLHLSNIPNTVDEEFLLKAFVDRGFDVKNFKFFPKDHKMALLQLGSVEDALLGLIDMHNFKLADNAHLRVSFSKSGI